MYFSKINDPKQLRKEVLLAAKEAIIILSNQKRTVDITQRKQELTEEITKTINEIHKQTKKLDEILPNKELKKEPIKENSKPKPINTQSKGSSLKKFETAPKQKKTSPEEIKNPEITDLDRLDYTLKKIEEKLAKLEN